MPPTIAIHQPNYLPWLGYFFKIFAADIFVFHDNVQYTKRGPTRRTSIRQSKGSLRKSFLTVPLRRHSDYDLIRELEIDHGQGWVKKQLNQVRNTYSGAPYYDSLYPFLEETLQQAEHYRYLADWNIFLVGEFCRRLEITAPTLRSSALPVEGQGARYNLRIVQHLGGGVYLSGAGGRKYQQEENFIEEGIAVQYADLLPFLEAHPYFQAQGAFLNGLSVIDALFNVGEEGVVNLFQLLLTHQKI